MHGKTERFRHRPYSPGTFSFYDGVLDTAFLFDLILTGTDKLDVSVLDNISAAATRISKGKGAMLRLLI